MSLRNKQSGAIQGRKVKQPSEKEKGSGECVCGKFENEKIKN
jgi:hypothetical protein